MGTLRVNPSPAFCGLRVKGNAPGNARGTVAQTSVCAAGLCLRGTRKRAACEEHRLKPVLRFTESATENIPPAGRSTVASRRKTCETSSKCSLSLARVKRWGKSPPLRWQHRRHGKPRVVQGQIGGESRPGSPSTLLRRPPHGGCCKERLPRRWRKLPSRATLG